MAFASAKFNQYTTTVEYKTAGHTIRSYPRKFLYLNQRIRFKSRFRIRKPHCVKSQFSTKLIINKSKQTRFLRKFNIQRPMDRIYLSYSYTFLVYSLYVALKLIRRRHFMGLMFVNTSIKKINKVTIVSYSEVHGMCNVLCFSEVRLKSS